MKKLLCMAGLAAVGAFTAVAGNVKAPNHPAFYVFGDSLSDAGNDYIGTAHKLPISPPYFKGHFTNGLTWAEYLVAAEGPAPLLPSLAGGDDYAFGGAESGPTVLHDESFIDLPSQLAQFQANVPFPDRRAVYTLWIGANDLLDIIGTPNIKPKGVARAIDDIVANEVNFVTAISRRGAKHILVVAEPDLGVTPSVRSMNSPEATAAATAVSKAYNAALTARMTALAIHHGLDLRILDVFGLIDDAVAHPAKYDLTNVTDPCWTGGFTSDVGTLCSMTLAGQNSYLFWDTLHPTTAVHEYIYKAALAAFHSPPVTAPLMNVSLSSQPR